MAVYHKLQDKLKLDDFSAQFEAESFDNLFESSDGASSQGFSEGQVIKGSIVAVDDDMVIVDAGLKSEGRIPLREFQTGSDAPKLEPGTIVDVYIERLEDRHGDVILSREKARREAVWEELEKAYENTERVQGVMFSRVKGGFTVDLGGAVAFLPGSQVDIRPIKDVDPLMNVPQPFMVLKMDRARGNIIVSRRAVLEESRAEAKSELVANMEEGAVLDGVVKNITDYGAFIDLGGVDGLLHVTDVSWRRINHPSDVLKVGDTIQVKVVKFNKETQRISLGMKQLSPDPWESVDQSYPLGSVMKGMVTNITDYGAFVELEDGVEGLVHVSEMSWTKKNMHPGKIVATSQEVDVKVLEIDREKRRLSLGMKQVHPNPWEAFAESHKSGDELEGEIRNITDFGMFVALNEDLDGMVHASDLSWDKSGEEALKDYKPGDMIKVKILDIDPEKERISLGVKQLTKDVVGEGMSQLKSGEMVTCTVSKVTDGGLEVSLQDGLVTGFIRRSDLARERSEQRFDRFAEGEKVDAVITSVDGRDRRVQLSIKAREIKEEKQAMAEFGSSDSGASLGDILGAALDKAKENAPEAEKAEKKPAAKKSAKKAEEKDAKAEDNADDKEEKKASKSKAKSEKADEAKAEKKPAAKKTAEKKKKEDDDKAE